MSIKQIELRVIQHMTEEEDRVLRSLLNALPEDLREKVKPVAVSSKGHYGDTIIFYKVVLEKEDAEKAAEFIIRSFDKCSVFEIKNTFYNRFSDNSFHLRLDKFKLLENKFIISNSDDVVKIVIKESKKGSIKEIFERAGISIEEQ
ncbi:hypothetical protein IOK49_00120 [Fervidicoccus fontis]|uniref:Exosome protein n=2 Tax=Fervidicoccus fontis TaxID=683846 RepID=I0A2A9_FERFK|nr:RNA-binding domain-containing protein [Fervidicoccus fontis]AFH43116.1 hypothetical protein FFONT_1128 [Fervidicoccus fontis Kam940]MBE9390495.1 hypothetical protein [Fervidicoccus fontis]PMB75876.1 MAG: hypothetical protein C0188_01460 [Fervidicoccus fontis]PMB77755.1 MAG: hypothetical protein C0177_02425 [Fervidicoccus fontis]HEW64297.1 hypothetical protein [Fervidicoccus fontis]